MLGPLGPAQPLRCRGGAAQRCPGAACRPAPCRRGARQLPRRPVAVRAWDGAAEDAGRWQLPDVQLQPDGPHTTLQRMLDVIREGNLDGMLEFCPDEVIDMMLAWRKDAGSSDAALHFEDIIKASSDPDLLYLDTFAVRNLIMTAPHSVRVLSAMQVTPDKYLQRCAIVSPSGEECVLTFTVVLQDCLECQYKGPPLLSKKWMLRGVTGECHSDELPSHPSPSFPPEAVVEAQLAALREGRVAPVFAHASPENKAASGPVERFASMLQHNPMYSPLMGHAAAETVQRLQPSESTYMEVIRITPSAPTGAADAAAATAAAAAGSDSANAPSSSSSSSSTSTSTPSQPGQPLLFMWIVSRQPGSSTWANCWMTDAVQLVNVMPVQPPSSSSNTSSSSSSSL